MLVPLKWLREFVAYPHSAKELAEALTMAGLEVEGIARRHEGLDKVITARVKEVKAHPQAERLHLAVVDTGRETHTIVCGAPNLREGMLSALALPGARLAGDLVVKKAKIRGVESLGMLCSERELGLSEDHSGILDLDGGLSLGRGLVDALNLETEVLEVAVTANRGDCLSVLGIARDVAAISGLPITMPKVEFSEHQPPITADVKITVADPVGCPRYAARLVRGVKIGPSPLWLADRLMATGVRPISNVVDVTNYILMERGQPLHAFDFRFLAEGRIHVRQAEEGEVFITLDGQERALKKEMLLICDGERPVAVAGVMGGLSSEIKDDTKTVLIESAFFNPMSIRRTIKALALSTEASFRFERAIDLAGCAAAADRAAQLMVDLASGQVAAGIIDVYPKTFTPARVPFSVRRTADFLGLPLGKEEATGPLDRLGVKLEAGPDGDTFWAEPPAHRPDLERFEDLAEEVARLVGFDRIPEKSPRGEIAAKPRAWNQQVREKARDLMTAQGFDEAINYSFAHPQAAEQLNLAPDDPRRRVVRLVNPLSEDQSVLRTSLLPGLLMSLSRNLAHRQKEVALFEVGKVFWARENEKLPQEPSRLAGLLCGLAQPPSWWAGEAPATLAHAKGAVEYLAEGLNLPPLEFVSLKPAPPYLDPAACSQIRLEGEILGEVGRLGEQAVLAFDLDRPVFVFDLDFDLLAQKSSPERRFTALPRFPEVMRDIAIVVSEKIGAGEILAAPQAPQSRQARKWLKEVTLFDLYRGKPLAAGQKSLGLRFTYRDDERTLTEKEIQPLHEEMVQSLLERFGGVLR